MFKKIINFIEKIDTHCFYTIETNIQPIFSINHNELRVKLLPDKVICIKLKTDILVIHVDSKIEIAKKVEKKIE